MNTKYNTLFRHLIEEADYYENLQQAARKKQDAIVDGNIEQLNLATNMEQSLVKQGNKLTEERYGLLREALTAVGCPQKITLSAFILEVNPANKREWVFLKKRIENSAAIIHRLNRENAMLFHTSIHFVQDIIQFYYPRDELKGGLYTAEGTTKENTVSIVDYGV